MANKTHITDGGGIRVALNTAGLDMFEKSVTPHSTTNGDKIDITTNDNASKKTFAPHRLNEDGDHVVEGTYSIADLDLWRAVVGVPDTITVTWPTTIPTVKSYEGWLMNIEPGAAVEGEQPTATYTFALEGEAPVTPV